MGFFINNRSGLLLLDRDGNILADWFPHPDWPQEMLGNLVDVERDAAGRWYLSWFWGVVEVFSPDRMPIGPILSGGWGDLLQYRNGALFMETHYDFRVVKIEPGF